jgi:hypothetical protein
LEGVERNDAEHGTVNDDGDDKIFGDLGNDWLVGGTGRDNIYGGWGDDLLNADDDHSTNGGQNDGTDTHPTYEDRAYGGAGRDRLIANTGGDRLIDWVGEFDSYLLPFAPFGIGTVSRTLQPQLADFLYALSASDGADPSRVADGAGDEDRNGEPGGELGLIRQQDPAWQQQTGAPDDPEAGNIPGGPRDVLRSTGFNNPGQASGFFADSGTWEVSGGKLQVSAESMHGDAVAVYHIEDALPTYFELQASISIIKSTGGWNGNAYMIFDYQSPTDFKFAGIDDKINKLVMGHRDASGWHIDEQAFVQGGVKADKTYNMLLAVNGVTVTLVVDNKNVFTHVYEPRVIDGYAYNLNFGLVGMGSDNSRGTFDNVAVQILPPQITFDETDDFSGSPELTMNADGGIWTGDGTRYNANPDGGTATSFVDLGVEFLNFNSYLELKATVNTTGRAGFIFDRYENSFKFVAIDAATDQLIIGHYTTQRGWATDAVASKDIDPGADHVLGISLKGTTVSATLDGQAVAGFVFNATTVDGQFGLLATDGPASFDDFRVQTDDRELEAEGEELNAAGAPKEDLDTLALSDEALAPIVEFAAQLWTMTGLVDAADLLALDTVTFEITDFQGTTLGLATADAIYIDVDGAGYGWFIDPTPADSSEYAIDGDRLVALPSSEAHGRMDLLTVVLHEMGHALGFDHQDDALMEETLEAGERVLIPTSEEPEPLASEAAGSETSPRIDWTAQPATTGRGWAQSWQNRYKGAAFPEFVLDGADEDEDKGNPFVWAFEDE